MVAWGRTVRGCHRRGGKERETQCCRVKQWKNERKKVM